MVSHPVLANSHDYRYRKAFKVQRLSTEQGLASSMVNDLIQDQNGYIWLATEDGLSRFDSYEFTNFRHDHRDQHSLHENLLISLEEDPGKGIWIGTNSGVSFFDFKTQKFKNYAKNDPRLRIFIRDIVRLENGDIYFATIKGLFRLDRAEDKIVAVESNLGKRIITETASLVEDTDYIYVSSRECVTRIEKNSFKFYNMCDLPSLAPLKRTFIFQFLIQNDSLWFATNRGLFHYNIKTDKLRAFYHDENNPDSLANDFVQDLAVDAHGGLWLATTYGLDYYDADKNIFRHYGTAANSDEGLSALDIVSIIIDSENLVWLGTAGGGVNVINPNQPKFEHILTKSDVHDLGGMNAVYGLALDQKRNLWMATFGGGLFQYNLLTGKISKLKLNNDSELPEYAYSLFIDYQHRLWLGTFDRLSIIDLERNVDLVTTLFIDGVEASTFHRPFRIIQTYLGEIYLATNSGLYVVTDVSQDATSAVVHLKDITQNMPEEVTNNTLIFNTIMDDADGNLWIGTTAGLIYHNVEEDKYMHFTYDQDNPQSISSNDVSVIYQDSNGFIWIGTGDGLNRVVRSELDKEIFYFERITTYEGLPNNTIYGIIEDDRRQLWISTNLGLVKYANGAISSDTFRRADGLSSDEFSYTSYLSDGEGRLYFGSMNGVTIINDFAEQKRSSNSRLVFTHLRVGERELDLYQLNNTAAPKITQRSDEAAIDLSVANMNFGALGTQRYRYRILGLDKNWNYLGTQRNIFVAGLPEGNYTIEIQTQVSGTPWSSEGKLLEVKVETDFWSSSQANYLIGFVLLAIFAVLLLLVSRYYKNLLSRSQKRNTLEALRVRELRVDNDSLKGELAKKAEDIQTLSRKVQVGEQKLDVEKYRDVATGFYRLNYFYRLEGDDFLEESADRGKGFDSYKSIGVLELREYAAIFQRQGPLAVSEFVSQLSIIIRQNLKSGVQIFQIQSGIYLILGCDIDYPKFEDELLNLGNIIRRSEVNVANGISESTDISQTFMNLKMVTVNSKRQLDVVIDLLIQLHQQLNLESATVAQRQRIILKDSVNPKELSKTNWRLEELLEQEIIEINGLP